MRRVASTHLCHPHPSQMLRGDVWRCECGQRWRCAEHPLYAGGRYVEAITWWQKLLGL